MQERELNDLLFRYRSGTATEEEKAFLESWYLHYNDNSDKEYRLDERLADAESIWKDLQLDQKIAKVIPLWYRITAAASVILCLSIGGYILLNKKEHPQLTANQYQNDIAPGTNKAILSLPNGKKISLSDVKNGQLLQQNGTIINKIADTKLVYNERAKDKASEMVYDTLSVPRAGHFKIIFADGSKAWLNAATIIRYPENFQGKDRQIELIKGEAYFEVVHSDKQPFRVITHNQVIEDIGTHFNVNAYDDEPDVKTTLLEGSVKVAGSGQDVILKPGQQSAVKENSSSITVKIVDPDVAVAWKNDHFVFNDEGIESIMRQISRWYDVDITYNGNMSGKEFEGSVSRFKNVSQVLRKLEATGTIHFKIEGRKITVMP